MTKVFFDAGISLDGYLAGENRGPANPLGDGGPMIHTWMYKQKEFWNHLGIDKGERGGVNGELIANTIARTGAVIMGRRMFDEGEANWPEDLFKCPVYVLTHEVREPWIQKGSTTFYFINDGIHSALEKAQANAGGKDIRINGGADIFQQYLNAGLIDEGTVNIAPVVLGGGIRLFDNLDKKKVKPEIAGMTYSPEATHIHYKFAKKRMRLKNTSGYEEAKITNADLRGWLRAVWGE